MRIKVNKAKFSNDYKGEVGYKVNKCKNCGNFYIEQVGIHIVEEDMGWAKSIHHCGGNYSFTTFCENQFKKLRTLFRTENEAKEYCIEKIEKAGGKK